MWGSKPADSTIIALELFKKHGLKNILIPGFGYGRNAKYFTDNGLNITGIEISETAIALAQKYYGENLKVFHGPVGSMPFDQEMYDGIFCYALIHLLSAKNRIKLIKDCYNQLKPNGYMVFIAISKMDTKYGKGKIISKDTFETNHGVTYINYSHKLIDEYYDIAPFSIECLNEAIRLDYSTYDMLYLTLAKRTGGVLLTLDKKLTRISIAEGIDTPILG